MRRVMSLVLPRVRPARVKSIVPANLFPDSREDLFRVDADGNLVRGSLGWVMSEETLRLAAEAEAERVAAGEPSLLHPSEEPTLDTPVTEQR
jgi:hypothetical protein